MTVSTNYPPVFVLCCARSGSTLLRYILDTHPDVCCPPELHLADLCRSLMWVYQNTVDKPSQKDTVQVTGTKVLAPIRRTVSGIMDDYARRKNKSIWCEKSVFTIDRIQFINSVYPDARFICLYRNCLDVVHSAMEVSRNKGGGFGFEPYLARTPNNEINGMIDFWHDKTSRIRQFQTANPQQCIAVRFEDIVTNTTETLQKIFPFIGAGVEWDDTLSQSIFSTYHMPGPGDPKILSTNQIDQGTVGKGAAIPVSRISADRLLKMNHLLREIGYSLVGQY